MKLFNTLTRKKEDLKPLKPGQISLYTCGPTVYHYYHIGNLRNAVFNDTLKRVLIASGLKVHHVMNITDVGHLSSDADAGDDKLQSRAAEEGKTVWDVADFYLTAFKNDMAALNVIHPTAYVRATERINEQVGMVQRLLDEGFAYITKQAIYFEVSKLSDYGKLTGQKLTEKVIGAREDVVVDAEKHNPQDFALWFFAVERFAGHQMRWLSPWGEGFPGWHLECSAIIESELGETIDIHTGGVDHIGTHHTNEIAQSEAVHNGKPLANYWLHNDFLMVDGQKISKSKQNGYRLDELIEKGYSPMALRMLYLQSHYRSERNFTFDALDAAANFLDRLYSWADWRFQKGTSVIQSKQFDNYYDLILGAMQNDLNSPKALSMINQMVDECDQQALAPTIDQVEKIDQLLGLGLFNRKDITDKENDLISKREEARKSKDYQAADEARQQLNDQGIEIDDTASGPRWRRVG